MVNDSRLKLTGLIGYPVKYSLSPAIYNAAFEVLGLNLRYVVFPVQREALEEAVKGMAALGFAGFNVTIPYKEAVIPFLDSIHPEAEQIGAVNTVVISNGKLLGYNTDGVGFIRALEERDIRAAEKNVLLLGAGGAAKAVAVALARRGAASIAIAVRNLDRGKKLAGKLAGLGVQTRVVHLEALVDPGEVLWHTNGAGEEKAVPAPPDIIINATPVGMTPERETELIRVDSLPPHCIVCDLVYGPRRTLLLQKSAAAGHKVIDGSGMLLHQGAEAFFLFTGVQAPLEVMRRAMDVALCNNM